MATGSIATAAAEKETRPGDELEAVRRLDWRFLLPDPALDRVAVVGNPRGHLLDALRRFSGAVVWLDVNAAAMPGIGRFTPVVTQNPSLAELKAAMNLTASPGVLYAELARTLRHPALWARLARQAGFSHVRLYWHWPDFENCTHMVPLDDVAALLFTIRKKHAPLQAAIAAMAARWAWRSCLLAWGARHFSLVAAR